MVKDNWSSHKPADSNNGNQSSNNSDKCFDSNSGMNSSNSGKSMSCSTSVLYKIQGSSTSEVNVWGVFESKAHLMEMHFS